MKIVVIGAGVAGLSIGWRLALGGAEVVVLERAQPGRAATWAAGGMIAAAAEHADQATPDAEFAARAASLWPEFAREIEERSGRAVFYRRDGSLIAAPTKTRFDELAARAGGDTSLLDAAEARRLEPLLSEHIVGALFAPGDAQVDNRALGMALAYALVNAGGTLQTNEAVVRLEVSSGSIQGARTPFTLHQGDAYVLAAGAWSGEIKGVPREALPPVIPVKGEMIAFRPANGATLPTRLLWGHDVYLIPRHDRLFVGATATREGFDTAPTDGAADWLAARATALLPALSDWEIVEHWAGLRPGSPDDLPIVGETALSGLFVASGQYRNGILLAPAIADALHSLILERRTPPDIRGFDPKRFA
ncbi:MAG TPA: glycine oxidase ThiO [Rhizomicrobium sp.]|nr:glycine oxidase ThiO [Rhizomicrobium sp.]